MSDKTEHEKNLKIIDDIWIEYQKNLEARRYIHHLERYKKSNNPIYLWACIDVCIENELPLPDECNTYLANIAKDLIYGEHEEKLPQLLVKIMGFNGIRKDKGLAELRNREINYEKNKKVNTYAEQNNISRNEALQDLKITVGKDLDKHFISKMKKAADEKFEDALILIQSKTKTPIIGSLYEAYINMIKAYMTSTDREVTNILYDMTQEIRDVLNKKIADCADKETLDNFWCFYHNYLVLYVSIWEQKLNYNKDFDSIFQPIKFFIKGVNEYLTPHPKLLDVKITTTPNKKR